MQKKNILIGALLLAFLAVAAYFVYQNIPAIEKVISNKGQLVAKNGNTTGSATGSIITNSISETVVVSGSEKILELLTPHQHPQAGDDWDVSFLTTGSGDLEIIPQDQNTINDIDFVSLRCGDEILQPQTLKDDVIFYSKWSCDKEAKLVHKVNVARAHQLKFVFNGNYAFAYNSPDTVTDSFTDTTKLQSRLGLESVTTTPGEIRLSPPPKRVFVTSGSWTGDLGGIGGGDKKCQAEALAAGLGGEWVAWLSDINTSASDRITHHPGYIMVNGTWIAESWIDLTDALILTRIDKTIDGVQTPYGFAWTGTRSNGQRDTTYANPPCANWYASTFNPFGLSGYTNRLNEYWTYGTTQGCSTQLPLYCFER
jgi:hypothetical protein